MTEPIPRDTLNAVHKQDEDKGAKVHSFDPDSSPEEKAAHVANGQPSSATNGGVVTDAREVKLDTGGPPGPPTITLEDFDKVGEEGKTSSTVPAQPDNQSIPGTIPDGPAPNIPDWYRVGWRAVSQIDQPMAEGEQHDRDIIALFVDDMYYGQWYHNAGIIFFAVVTTYFLTLLRFGWGWLIIVLAICGTYYNTSMGRLRRTTRDDIQRELTKNRLVAEHETADWINNFLSRFWLIYEPVLSATIVSSVDWALSFSTPPGVESMALSTFTLGTKAPKVEKVQTYPNTAEDVILMDWEVSFNPTDLSHFAPAHAVNSKIELRVRLGKGLAAAPISILVENIAFRGDLQVKLKLVPNFPHIQIMELSFKEKPFFDYVLKPVGGDTFGFDINHIPGLSSFIRDQVHATLGPMMYAPHVFVINLEQMLSGTPIDAANGVLQVKVLSAKDLKGAKLGGGAPDPYVSLSIEHRAELAKTKFKRSSRNPYFGSTHYLLLNSSNLQESLTLNVFDHNDHFKDSELGTASYELRNLVEDATREGIVAKVLRDGKERGEIKLDLSYFPVLTPAKGPDGHLEPVPETSVGIVRLVLHQGKDLDMTKALTRDLNPLAKVLLHHRVVHKTRTLKHTASPIWESTAEFIVSDRASSDITVKVIDEREILKDPVIGFLKVPLDDLLAAKTQQRDWFPLSGCNSGKLRMTVEWKPLAMAGSVQGAAGYTPPIGVVRLWIKKATDVKNVEATLGGKSDPYVRVQMHGIILARTEVINNNLNPEWDAIIYVPVHAVSDTMVLETMDYQNLTKDRTLGYCELSVKDLAKQNVEDVKYPFAPIAKLEKQDPIRLKGNIYKGKLHYAAEFVPAFNLHGATFPAAGTELGDGTQEGSGEDVGSGDETSDTSDQSERVTIAKSHRRNASVSSSYSAKTAASTKTTDTMPPVPEHAGIEMSSEELLNSQSGVLAVNVISGELRKRARFELLVDGDYWPAFSTEKSRTTSARWDQAGEGFIRELDFANVWLRLNEDEEGLKEDIIGELKMKATDFIGQCLDKEADFVLTHRNGGQPSRLKLMAKYIPVPVVLEPRESMNNMGTLTVEVIGANGLLAVDRGGKSDPYALFTLNGQKAHKTEKKTKTLAPKWDEDFDTLVPSRVAARFEVEVFDWNQIERDESLGRANIDLADLEPFQATERVLNLQQTDSTKGTVTIRMVFKPHFFAQSRKNTSTFSVAGRAATQVGGLPFNVIKGTAHGVGTVGSKTFGLLRRNKTAEDDDGLLPAFGAVPEPPSTQISQPADVTDALNATGEMPLPIVNSSVPPGSATPPTEPGTLKVTVASAKDLVGASAGEGVKPYVVLKIGKRECQTKHTGKTFTPEWNEQFVFPVGPETQALSVTLWDHKALSKDKLLAETDIDIWQHIHFGETPILASDVWAELRNGTGHIHLRLEYEKGLPTNASTVSLSTRTPLASPSRFNISRRTPTRPSQDD